MSLKPSAPRTDKPSMFVYSKDKLALSEACLHSLFASLNAPVVEVEGLPQGPVRAAVVIYAEEYGDLCLVIGLRALEAGETAMYRYRGVVAADEIDRAMDDALHFAEGLGFLFDDNMLSAATNAGRRVALEHWLSLMGDGRGLGPMSGFDPSASTSGLEVAPPEDDLLLTPMEDLLDPAEDLLTESMDGELLLDDLIPLDEVVAAPAESDFDPAETAGAEDIMSEAALPSAPPPTLTKFRSVTEPASEPAPVEPLLERADERTTHARGQAEVTEPMDLDVDELEFDEADGSPFEADDADSDAPVQPGGSALGRIPIVRRRQGGDPSRPSFVSRLLASF